MRLKGLLLIMLTTALAAATLATTTLAITTTGAHETDTEAANKKTVVAFYEQALNQKDFAAAQQYLGPHYIQHNPFAADDHEGLRDFLAYLKQQRPSSHSEIKRVLADGDLVMVHIHNKANQEDRGSAIVDIFRLESGKIVEHWDVVQKIPEQAANGNGMF